MSAETDRLTPPPLARLFASPARAKIIGVFADHPHATLSIAEITDYADIHRTTFHEHVDLLLDVGYLVDVDNGSTHRTFELADNALTRPLVVHSQHLNEVLLSLDESKRMQIEEFVR